MITRYHARYYASLLTQKSVGGDIESLSQSLLSSSVDINPHQIDAALFAFKSPFNKGVVLAARVLAGTAADLMEQPELLKAAREEFNETAAAGYDCPIGPEVTPSAQ